LPSRLRKLIGAVILGIFVPFYAMVVMVIASEKLPGLPVLVQTLAYAALGLFWVLPAGLVITWMQKPDRKAS